MIFLTDADIVLPDRVLSPGTLVIDGDRIIDVVPDAAGALSPAAGDLRFDLRHHIIVPGFIDAHAHPLMYGQMTTWVDCGPARAGRRRCGRPPSG